MIIDIILLLLVLIFTIWGYTSGFIIAFFRLLKLAAGVLLSFLLTPSIIELALASGLFKGIPLELMTMVVRLLIFVLSQLMISFIARAMTATANALPLLGSINRLLGLLLGTFCGAASAFFVLYILIVLSRTSTEVASLFDTSQLLPLLRRVDMIQSLLDTIL